MADLVNRKMAEVIPVTQPISHQVLLLLAMTLAEDVLKAREEHSHLKTEVKQRSQTILTQLEREFPL